MSKRTARLLTRLELAKALEVTPRSIDRWRADEGLPVAKRGRGRHAALYSLAAVRAWLRERDKRPPTELQLARAHRDRCTAELLEQKVRQRAAELLSRADVEKVWSAEIADITRRLGGWPAAAAALVTAAANDGVDAIERVLRDEVHRLLTELADTNRVAAF